MEVCVQMRCSYLRIAHSAGITLMYWLSCACVAKKFHQIVTPVYVSNLIIFVFSVSALQHDGKLKLNWPSLAISPPSPHFNVLLIKPHEYSNEMAMNINKMRWICYLGSCHISRPSVEGAAVGTLNWLSISLSYTVHPSQGSVQLLPIFYHISPPSNSPCLIISS